MSQLSDAYKQMKNDLMRSNLRNQIYSQFGAERLSQETKWGEQSYPHYVEGRLKSWRNKRDCARRICNDRARDGILTWEDILWEEFTEAMAETDWSKRRAELIQVAAVIVAEIEDGDISSTGTPR